MIIPIERRSFVKVENFSIYDNIETLQLYWECIGSTRWLDSTTVCWWPLIWWRGEGYKLKKITSCDCGVSGHWWHPGPAQGITTLHRFTTSQAYINIDMVSVVHFSLPSHLDKQTTKTPVLLVTRVNNFLIGKRIDKSINQSPKAIEMILIELGEKQTSFKCFPL